MSKRVFSLLMVIIMILVVIWLQVPHGGALMTLASKSSRRSLGSARRKASTQPNLRRPSKTHVRVLGKAIKLFASPRAFLRQLHFFAPPRVLSLDSCTSRPHALSRKYPTQINLKHVQLPFRAHSRRPNIRQWTPNISGTYHRTKSSHNFKLIRTRVRYANMTSVRE